MDIHTCTGTGRKACIGGGEGIHSDQLDSDSVPLLQSAWIGSRIGYMYKTKLSSLTLSTFGRTLDPARYIMKMLTPYLVTLR